MLTARGWAMLASAAVAVLAGRVLGIVDLFIVGAGLVVCVAVAVTYVMSVRPIVSASRLVRPPRVHAEGSSRVELALINQARRRSPVLGVRDPFDGGARWAKFQVAPLAPGELARAAYRLPTDQRGVFDLGPLSVRVSDPFGIAARHTFAAPATRLTVYPRVDAIAAMPTSQGDDPLAGQEHPHALAGPGGDFYTLRPYVRGDDLRRVHWPSTARTDELMIRQDELPWQGRATIVVDTRAATTTPEAFELVLSAAASIVTACWQRRSLLRLVTTAGFDSGFAAGNAHVDTIFEHLAAADTDAGHLRATLASLRRGTGGGALAVVTTALAPIADLQAVAALQSRFGTAALVVFERSSWAPAAPPLPERAVPIGTHLVRASATVPFAAAWAATFGPAPAELRLPSPVRSAP